MKADTKHVHEKINFWVDYIIKNRENSSLRDDYVTHQFLKSTPVDIFLFLLLVLIISFSLLIYVICVVKNMFKSTKQKQH